MYGLLRQDSSWQRYNYLKIWNIKVQQTLYIEKIAFKVVQMKFLAMHITNQKFSFDIFTVGNVQNILMENQSFWPIQVLLAISKNISVRLKNTGFMVQGHKWIATVSRGNVKKQQAVNLGSPTSSFSGTCLSCFVQIAQDIQVLALLSYWHALCSTHIYYM